MISTNYSHLLSRPERTFDEAAIDKKLVGKRVLITGAGGSIGSALSHRILSAKPEIVYLLGHGEDSIFQLTQHLKEIPNLSSYREIIADAYSHEVSELLRLKEIQYVFHTAAHKHVALQEKNPRAALANNTQTTIWLARKCEEVKTRFVYVSTDKAVNPTTVMGASKKLAEAWIDANCKNAVTIRLGNVLGSAGSLVEILTRLARLCNGQKREFTLSHPDMQRYFVTAKEAVGLILHAGTGQPGKFTLDMGYPVHIGDFVKKNYPCIDVKEAVSFTKVEKTVEELFENDEGCTCPLDGVVEFHRDVEPKLISAILEIIEDHANSGTSAKDLARLVVDLARRV